MGTLLWGKSVPYPVAIYAMEADTAGNYPRPTSLSRCTAHNLRVYLDKSRR